MPSLIVAGDATNGVVLTSSNDNALTIQTGAAGAKVNAIALDSAGQATLISGPTIGTAPTPTPSGNAPLYGARAWCVFDGTTVGTNAPTAGGNVTNITRNATGDYTINFTTAMPDANYVVTGASTGTNVSGQAVQIHAAGAGSAPTLKSTTQVRIYTGNTSAANDGKQITIVIFR